MSGRHVLAVRLDNAGDVLLTGPAVRAVAGTAARVTYWCGPGGNAAAGLLPGVDEVLCAPVGWIEQDPAPVEHSDVDALVSRLTDLDADEAVVFTSFHQSPLPTALLLRMAGVATVAAVSGDYPGSLLDVRHRVDGGIHEVERGLSLVATLGYRLPAGDSARLAIRRVAPAGGTPRPPYVVVHPGTSVPARAWSPASYAALVDGLLAEGWRVAVTGGPDETGLTAAVARGPRPGVTDLGGRTSWRALAAVLASAEAVVAGNTGPAHLAAAVATPVVSVFAPTVPPERWRPWGVAHELLGDLSIACGGCRARDCPIPGHPCVDTVRPAAAIDALRRLLSDRDRAEPWPVGGPV